MGLFGLFGRRAIRDPAALATFIDAQSLLLGERSVQDYARGRAGVEAEALFAVPTFRAALEKARWEAYPRALAMIGELVEGELRAHAGANKGAVLAALTELILTSFDRHAAPQAIGAGGWSAARAELSRSLGELARERPRTLDAVAETQASYYLAIMPIDARLQADDFPALRNQLRASLTAIKERFVQQATLPALAEKLAALAPQASPNPD
jgi:hypothetical protein